MWEFIRDILLNPERNPGLIKWEDRTEGIFRFLKSEAVAQLWGKKKNNSSMTYEKLSRAMRYNPSQLSYIIYSNINLMFAYNKHTITIKTLGCCFSQIGAVSNRQQKLLFE